MATKMKSKFDKYREKGDKINHLLYMAVVLDPRKKLRFLKFFFSEIYGNEVADEMVELVSGSLVKLYDYYFVLIHQMYKYQVGVRGYT